MATIRIMAKDQFAHYKRFVSLKVEERRAKGKEWKWLVSFITNFISQDRRYAFTGKQIRELIMLAEEPVKEGEEDGV